MQRSAQKIRNPFKFDFQCKWNGETVTLPGDGDWYTFVGPLATHITRHLKMAVLNRFHDENVAKLKREDKIEDARKFRVSEAMVNHVHKMITGKDDPSLNALPEDIERAELDLSILQKDMQQVTSQAAKSSSMGDISSILNAAQVEGEALAETVGEGQSASGSGQAAVPDMSPQEEQLPTQPLENSVEESPVVEETAEQPTEEPEFPGLAEL